MPRKSNKTSYVMNLITNGEPENQEQTSPAQQEATAGQSGGQAEKEAAAQQPAAAGAEPDNKNVVVVDQADTTDKISEAIRQQLEINLGEQEEEKEKTQQTQEDVAEGGDGSIMQDINQVPETETKAASSGDAKMSDEEIQKMFASMQGGEPEPVAAEPATPEPAAASSSGDAKMSDEEIQKLFASMQGGEPATAAEPAEPAAQPAAPEPAAASSSGDAKMSDEEIQKMFASMQGGEPATAAEPAEPAAQPAAPEPAPAASSGDAKMSDEEIQKMIASMQGGQPEAAAEPAAPEPAAPEPAPAVEEEEKPYRTVNVMEAIVGRIDLEKHMKDYDVCLCGRCRADVRALMLTRLPSKYVVMNDTSVNPMLNYYEGKFKIRVYTEILRACMEVKERPRHKNQSER